MTALAAMGIAAAVILLRDHLRLERHARALEADVGRLRGEVRHLTQSSERAHALVNSQRDFVVHRDEDGSILFINDSFAKFLQAQDAAVGAKHRSLPAETRPGPSQPDGARAFEEAYETPDGLRWISWIETPIAAQNGVAGTLRVGRDVTARVQSEQAAIEGRSHAEAACEAKSRSVATLSHELRTPLHGMLGMADLVLDTCLDPEQTSYVRTIKASGEALLTLVDGLLDTAKIEAGHIELVEKPVTLRPFMDQIAELLAPRAQGKGLDIAAYVAPSLPATILADEERLRQVLLNVAGNAVKFTDAGGIGILVDPTEAGDLRICICDTGPGVAPEELPKLFAEFERGQTNSAKEGSGLGLAITRRIVDRMGGTIDVESSVGRGTMFRVVLPMRPVASPESRMPAAFLTGQTVLILSQSPFGGPLLARQLEEAGAGVALTRTAPEALAKIATQDATTVIVDSAIGTATAREVSAEARRLGAKTLLLMLTPFERRELGSPAETGFDAFLVKPVRFGLVLDRLAATNGAEHLAQPSPTRPQSAEVAGPPRVLLAEDNDINALLALRSLEQLGAVVDWARDGQEALALAEASFSGARPSYSLVLMDLRMPGLDGLETARRIRLLERTLRPVEPTRIIALTASTMREDRAAARDAGFDGFLSKPYRSEALARLLGHAKAPLAQAS